MSSSVEPQVLDTFEVCYDNLNNLGCEHCVERDHLHAKQMAQDLLPIVKEVGIQNSMNNESSDFIVDVKIMQNQLLHDIINFDAADAQIMYWQGTVSDAVFNNVLLGFRLTYIEYLCGYVEKWVNFNRVFCSE